MEDKINIWMNYMVTQMSLKWFSDWVVIDKDVTYNTNNLHYPIFSINNGINNYPHKNYVIPFEEFTDNMFDYWKDIMKNKSGLIKWNSVCNYSSSIQKQ